MGDAPMTGKEDIKSAYMSLRTRLEGMYPSASVRNVQSIAVFQHRK